MLLAGSLDIAAPAEPEPDDWTVNCLTKYSITWTHIMQTDRGNHVLLASSHLTSQHQLSQSHLPVVWYVHTVSRLKGCCKPDTLLLCLQYKQNLLPSAAKSPPDCVISMKNTPPPTKWMEDLGFLLDPCYLLDKTCFEGLAPLIWDYGGDSDLTIGIYHILHGFKEMETNVCFSKVQLIVLWLCKTGFTEPHVKLQVQVVAMS